MSRGILQTKDTINRGPCLKFNADFILETDAYGSGLGVVLSQKQPNGHLRMQVVHYKSMKVTMEFQTWKLWR